MKFIKNLLINLALLVGIGIFLFYLYPDMMKQVFDLYGQLFGPLAIVMLIVFSLPRRKGQRE